MKSQVKTYRPVVYFGKDTDERVVRVVSGVIDSDREVYYWEESILGGRNDPYQIYSLGYRCGLALLRDPRLDVFDIKFVNLDREVELSKIKLISRSHPDHKRGLRSLGTNKGINFSEKLSRDHEFEFRRGVEDSVQR